ncbi:MAG: type II secretion system protein [Nitrospirae bacterium]|nr:type II secretion system protein [Nitrospirota bacterium]
MKSSNHRRSGFTLIEVIVSIAILSICLVMIMRLFSAGLRASRSSCDYTRAVVHAKEKMEELSIKPVAGSGLFDDGFSWESELTPHIIIPESRYNLWIVKVRVSWPSGVSKESTIELLSLKAMTEEDET